MPLFFGQLLNTVDLTNPLKPSTGLIDFCLLPHSLQLFCSAFITVSAYNIHPDLSINQPSMSRLPTISNLMSPPEAKPLESFSITPAKTPSTAHSYRSSPEQTLAPMANSKTPDTKTMRILPSPPVSPWMNKQYKGEKSGHTASQSDRRQSKDTKDPILYPEGSFESVEEQPLFPAEASDSHTEIISKHIAKQGGKKTDQPTSDEYHLVLACVPQIGSLYNRNPAAYMKRQREEVEDQYWQAKRICARAGTRAVPIAIAPAPKQAKRAINRVATPTKPPAPRIKRTPKASPMAKLMGYPDKGRSATPDRLPGTKREDVDYSSLPNYAPPTDTLPPGNPKILKADWASNNVLNLSNDPDRHMLHEAEINLAGTLRLSCATYLCSKRRIFEARLNALRINKEFRKTDAQQACKIDVNKASKLWTAFDKVGWFGKGFFLQYL